MLAFSDPASQPSMTQIVVVVHYALLAVGGLIALGWAIGLIRSGRWRQPLADVRCTGQGPSFLHLVLVGCVYLLIQSIAIAVVVRFVDRDSLGTPGSHAAHTFSTVDGCAKLLACAFIVIILARVRSFAPAGRAARSPEPLFAPRMALISVAAMLMILPIVSLQLNMGQILWQRLLPNIPPPVHPTLESLKQSDWGRAGVGQLFVMAIVVAPIAEELFFRGLLLQTLCRYTRRAWVSIVLSGLAFGAVHLGQPQAVVPLATMGIILGYLRVRHRSIELCIVVHALFNAQSMVAAFLAPELV